MRDLFPSVQPTIAGGEGGLPPYREAAWDFARGSPVFRGGSPVVVTGVEAVKVWVYKALRTARARHEIYTFDFGCELEALVGRDFTDGLKRAEATRYVREALEGNPYITAVDEVEAALDGNVLSIRAVVKTIYGEVSINV